MATAPVKSPLHNFPPPFLKWGSKSSVNYHQRFRRPVDSPPPHPPPTEEGNHNDNSSSDNHNYHHRGRGASQLLDGDCEGGGASRLHVGSRSARNRASSADKLQRRTQSPPVKESYFDVRGDDCRGKAVATTVVTEFAAKDNVGGEAAAEEAVVEPAQKHWNLRPRRAAAAKSSVEIGASLGGGAVLKNGEVLEAENQSKLTRLRGSAEAWGSERREKRKFWVALSRDEIEEDIYALTGSKPARRPRKRPKNVQKQLDNLFPGLWLIGVSPEAYRNLDTPSKR